MPRPITTTTATTIDYDIDVDVNMHDPHNVFGEMPSRFVNFIFSLLLLLYIMQSDGDFFCDYSFMRFSDCRHKLV